MESRICFIAPYPELADLARNVKQKLKYAIDIRQGSREEGLAQAQKAREQGARIFISRGGTASIIRAKLDTPIVEIKLTGYDVLRALGPYRDTTEAIGIVGFSHVVEACRIAGKILGIPIRDLTLAADHHYVNWQTVQTTLGAFIQKYRVKTIIGDNVIANRFQFPGVAIHQITSGEEAIIQAIEEARNILEMQGEEKKTAERFRAIINFIRDGVIATDESAVITMINPVAEEFLGIHKGAALGRSIDSFIQGAEIRRVLESKTAEISQLHKVRKGHILANHIPIMVDNQAKGVVTTFQEVTKIQDVEQKIRQNLYAKGLVTKYTFADFSTSDPHMKRLIDIAKGYARTDATILIQGESGTGKEMLAQSIHAASKRAGGPFVAINCSAVPPQLLESEMFGYVEGAFTGAKKGGKMGLFELAHQGTIFLDEIGDMDKGIQARLLRVLEEKQVMRLGADAIIPVNVRVIAATNADLKQQVAQGKFRLDLFYRLNVLNLTIPPLCQRKNDIRLLARTFLQELRAEYDRPIENLPDDIIKLLMEHSWPGNVRELKNVMERIILSSTATRPNLPEVKLLLDELRPYKSPEQEMPYLLTGTLQEIKHKIIHTVLAEENYNKSRAAKRLGIDRGTVERFS